MNVRTQGAEFPLTPALSLKGEGNDFFRAATIPPRGMALLT